MLEARVTSASSLVGGGRAWSKVVPPLGASDFCQLSCRRQQGMTQDRPLAQAGGRRVWFKIVLALPNPNSCCYIIEPAGRLNGRYESWGPTRETRTGELACLLVGLMLRCRDRVGVWWQLAKGIGLWNLCPKVSRVPSSEIPPLSLVLITHWWVWTR